MPFIRKWHRGFDIPPLGMVNVVHSEGNRSRKLHPGNIEFDDVFSEDVPDRVLVEVLTGKWIFSYRKWHAQGSGRGLNRFKLLTRRAITLT